MQEARTLVRIGALALTMLFEPGGARPGETDAADLDAVLEIERLAVGHDDLARNDAQLTFFASVAFDHITGADRKSARELAYSHGSLSYWGTSGGTTRPGTNISPTFGRTAGTITCKFREYATTMRTRSLR